MTQIEITTMLQNIVKKSGKTIEEVQAKYDEIFENTPPGDQQTKVAIKQTNKELSNKSSAVSIQAVIVGIDRLFDFNDKKILNALELYNRDPSQAIASKAVKLDKDDKPIVLDQTEVWSTGTKNRRFGKPLATFLESKLYNTFTQSRNGQLRSWKVKPSRYPCNRRITSSKCIARF